MPLRLQSIQRGQAELGFLTFVGRQNPEAWEAKIHNKGTDGEQYSHYTYFMRDASSGECIGKLVVTVHHAVKRKGLFKKETENKLIDMDLTIDSGEAIDMRFLNRLPGSSGANEYYDVELAGHQRFQVETVNRHSITGSIEGKTQKVKASAFPFMLTVYDSLDAMNEALHVKEIFGTKEGLAPDFAAPGSAAIEIFKLPGNANEISSFLVGTVKSVKDVEVKLGGMKLSFALVRMETALGTLPVAMGRSVFNIEKIAPGKIVAMLADIKADFAIDQKPAGIGVPEDYENEKDWINKKADELYNMMTQGLDLEKELATSKAAQEDEEAREWIEKKADEVFNMMTKDPGSEATVDIEKADVGSIIEFGAYPQDEELRNLPIQWQVLAKEDGRILVISKYALDCQQYNTSDTDVTWETCSLRKWLNGTFLNSAFLSEEQDRIPAVTVNADKNPDYDTSPGNGTTDRVFLLSIAEADKYFDGRSARQCQGTDYCHAQVASKSDKANCLWWLRSPGCSSKYAAHVSHYGYVDLHGGHVAFYRNTAVRPALWINLKS